MSKASELEKFIARHGPKIGKSARSLGKNLRAAGEEGLEALGRVAKEKGAAFGRAAAEEAARTPLRTGAALATTGAIAAGEFSGHGDKSEESESFKKRRRPAYLADEHPRKC